MAVAEDWPSWRGPRGDGTSLEKNVPTQWDGAAGTNVAWKTLVPGSGYSSPVVFDDRIFLTACDEATEERLLLCLNRRNGETLWQRSILKAPLEKKHKLNSFASGTPATDGKLVYVTFLEPDFGSANQRTPGNMVVSAYDFAGELKWSQKPGRFASVHGYCSSPVLHRDLVIVNGDHDGDSYLVALDGTTGEKRWQVPRANKTRSYVTPIIRDIDGRTQMILSGSKRVTSYDPATGAEHWFLEGPTEQFVASLVFNGKFLFLTAGFPEHHILAIKPDGKGKLTDDYIPWRTKRNCSYVPSPIVEGQYFLVAADNGIATCFVAETGETAWVQRLGVHYSASLVSANGLVYFTADDGITKVVRPGPTLDVVAENKLGEYVYASAAISQGQLLLRGEKHLFCIGK